MEIWKTIPDWPDYSASTYGNIRRDTPGAGTFVGKILAPHPISRLKDGRPSGMKVNVRSSATNTGHSVTVHRLVLEAHVGPRPERLECCHGDGDATNNSLENLRWDTKINNERDKEQHGTVLRGDKHPTSKLTEAQAREIKALKRDGVFAFFRHKDIASIYGVNPRTISHVLNGVNWAWLTI